MRKGLKQPNKVFRQAAVIIPVALLCVVAALTITIRLYARYAAETSRLVNMQIISGTYPVTFYAGGGTIKELDPGVEWSDVTDTSATKQVTYGDVYGSMPVVERPGYILEGWNEPIADGYQQVEYIENATKQEWIGTEVSGNNNKLMIDAKIKSLEYGGYSSFYGNYNNTGGQGENNNVFRMIYQNSDNKALYFSLNTKAGGGSIAVNGWSHNTWHTIKQYRDGNKAYIRIDNNSPTENDVSGPSYKGNTNDTKIALFARAYNEPRHKMQLAYFKMTDRTDNTLLRDFVSCYKRTADGGIGEYGLYDKVTAEFYENRGDGAFTGGPEVNNFITEDSVASTSDVRKIYAVWKEDRIKVTYNSNKNWGADYITEPLRNVETIIATPSFGRKGYHVSSWNTKEDGTGTSYEPESTVTFSEDITLYAQWEPDTCTVYFDASPSSAVIEPITVTFDTAYGELATPECAGYDFVGWELERLPSQYREVEYIESHGNEYIDTKISGDNDCLLIESKMYHDSFVQYGYYYGNRIDENHNSYRLMLQDKDNDGIYSTINTFTGKSSAADGWTKNTWHTVSQYKTAEKMFTVVDGIATTRDITAELKGTKNTNNIRLFGNYGDNESSKPAPVRLAYLRMYDRKTGKMLRDYVPCYEKPAEEGGSKTYGLYDLVSETFYPNEGDGAFTGGNPVIVDDETIVTATGDHTLRATWEEKRDVLTLDSNYKNSPKLTVKKQEQN